MTDTEQQAACLVGQERGVWHCIVRHPYTGNLDHACGSRRKTQLSATKPAHGVADIQRCQRPECQRLYGLADQDATTAQYSLMNAATGRPKHDRQ